MNYFKTKVSDVQQVGEHYVWLKFELIKPYKIDFHAGQYVMIDIPGEEKNIRQYSIASPPSLEHQIDLLIDTKPNGLGSRYLKQLKPGDEVQVMGPAGNYVIREQDFDNKFEINFIATGSGIAPIMSMLLDLLQTKKSKQKISLCWGVRAMQDLVFEEDLRMLDTSFGNFSYKVMLSQPEEQWPFPAGRVTDFINEKHTQNNQRFYLCGGSQMIDEVKEILTKKNVPEIHIHWERFD